MAKALTNPTFDYSLLDKDTKGKLICYEGELSRSRKRVAVELVEHGKILHGVHELIADHSSGTFRSWLGSIGISPGSAQRAIDVYIGFNQLSNLDNLEVSALYILARDEKAKKKALKYADRGVKITHSMAKQIIEETNGGTPPEDDAPVVIDEDDSGEDGRTDADGTEPQENAPKPPRNGKAKRGGSPPKRLDRNAYYKQWDNAIGPLVRLVDKIAEGVKEKHDPHHEAIHNALNTATEEMMTWMGISP